MRAHQSKVVQEILADLKTDNLAPALQNRQFGTSTFLDHFHQDCYQKYVGVVIFAKHLIESPVKSIPVPNRALRHTKILSLLLILLMGMFYSVKLYQMKCFIFNCWQKGSVTYAKLSRCQIVHFQLLVPNCPGSELSGCHIVRF